MQSHRVLASTLMVGRVFHRRHSPTKHSLVYPLFMPCIDLDELEQLSQKVWGFGTRWWHWARFKRSDYLNGEGSLKHAVQDKVFELTGERFTGRVKTVCHLRYLGLYFSPVNFYYLYDEADQWRFVLAEVSNTPWNERHYYALPADAGERQQNWRHKKAFHVSPFNPINQQYVWKLKPPTNKAFVHLECHQQDGAELVKVFDATLALKAQPMTSKNLVLQLIKMPLQTVKVLIGIYWHALRLWIKRTPLHVHPSKGHQGRVK